MGRAFLSCCIVISWMFVARAQELPLINSGENPQTAVAEDNPILFSPEQEQEIQKRIDESIRSQDDGIVNFGYEKGFLISSKARGQSESDAAFTMRVNSWMQFRHTALNSHVTNRSQNDFEFERLRLTFQGNVYSSDIRYFIQLDGDSDQNSVSDWLDYYVTADLGHAAGCQAGSFGLKIGKWKLPFNRTRAESGWKLQFSDRSVASVFFDINRSHGIGLFGSFGLLDRTIKWETAVSNGFKTGGVRTFRSGQLDRNFAFSGRVWSDWIGEWGSDGEADISCHRHLAMRVGAGFAHTRVDREGSREFELQRVVDTGATLESILPASTNSYNVSFYALDANWKYRGASLLTEYYFRTLTDFRGAAVSNLFDHGFLVQGGKFVIGEQLELIARWARIQGDSGTLGATDQSFDEVAGGFVWYLNGQRAKLTFDVTRLNGAPMRDSALNVLPGDDGMLYRSQVQLYF